MVLDSGISILEKIKNYFQNYLHAVSPSPLAPLRWTLAVFEIFFFKKLFEYFFENSLVFQKFDFSYLYRTVPKPGTHTIRYPVHHVIDDVFLV